MRRFLLFIAPVALGPLLLAPGCGSDSTTKQAVCVDGGQCADASDGQGGQGGQGGGQAGSGAIFQDGGCPDKQQCVDDCCSSDEFCALDTQCAPDQGPCQTNDDCWFDSYCSGGLCIPYGVPPSKDRDEDCEIEVNIEAIIPAEQCRWTGPPANNAHPDHVHVMSTPTVIDFDLDGQPSTLAPSVVFTSFPTTGSYSQPGVLRIIDGKDCTQQFSFDDPADATMSPASVAVGDLDADGRAEIVAAAHGGGILAFKYDANGKAFARLWRSGTCPGGMGPPTAPDFIGGSDKWSGPSIHDLDDDGKPEIIYGGSVYRADGCVLSSSLGFPGYHKGVVPVIADVDEDGQMELVLGNGLYGWDAQIDDWVAEPYFKSAGLPIGQVAVADMGNYPLASQNNQDRAEIVIIASGKARVTTIEGTTVFGPASIPGGGRGGPPTIADFDGDSKREFATAGGSKYVVFDFDCLAGGNPADCGGQAKTDGVLWTQPSKDASSNTTGSSVFDFDADGSAEAVYADECFLRIYEGATGKVIYSAARSSGTTLENPVIVDVDGDYRTEIVSAVNDYAGTLGCPATDPLFPAASFQVNHGIVVLRDEKDLWASSRPVWNQHAYAVTHVGDKGDIPKTSQVLPNWKQPGLNNYRQNVQGSLDALGEPDLTAGGDVGTVSCQESIATIEARVCNRGTLPMVSGTKVSFYEGALNGPELCNVAIPIALAVAECMVVSCQTDLGGKTVDVFVMVDPDGETSECWENNNAALYHGVGCGKKPT